MLQRNHHYLMNDEIFVFYEKSAGIFEIIKIGSHISRLFFQKIIQNNNFSFLFPDNCGRMIVTGIPHRAFSKKYLKSGEEAYKES